MVIKLKERFPPGNCGLCKPLLHGHLLFPDTLAGYRRCLLNNGSAVVNIKNRTDFRSFCHVNVYIHLFVIYMINVRTYKI